MHKWKLFKKSAALVLSSAVIASGVPVTAMASEAEVFSDVSGETQGETAQEEGENEDQESVSQDQPEVGEADIQSEEPEESDAEAIQEEVAEISAEEIQQEEQIQEDTKEVFGDGEAFMTEAGEVLQDASEITVAGVKYLWSIQPAEGYTQIGTTGVYVKAADGQTALTGKLYGTTTLSYSEFYAGDTTQESYDAITSATTSKNQIFTNEDSTEVTSSGYQIQGVKNVSVAVDAETYVDAQVLKAVSKLPKKGVYTEAADITLNEAPSQETGQYKTLNTDGTYSATKFDVKATVTDASAQIQAPSIWGDYMLVVKEVGTKYLRNSRQGDFAVGGNTLGVILETASGKKVGLRHTYEIWVQPYELAFSTGSGLIGEKISKVTYITPDGSYVYEFGDKAPLVKKQPEAGMKVQAAFVKENTTQVKVDDLDKYENPKVSVYYTTGRGHGKKTTYVVDHAAAENGVVTFDSSVARAGDEIYTVMISSDNYVDMTKNITLTGQPITVSNVSYYWVKGAVDGYTQIPGTDIYYKAANGHQALTGTLYGTASLSYEEFYAGDATSRKYDSVTSATTRKSTAFGNADVQNLTENGYEIAGVKKVSVATDAKTYVEARILSEAGELPESGAYIEAAGITLGRTPTVEPGQYKTLNADGTYSATKFNVKATVTDAEATLNTSSRWGDYEIKVKETSTKYLRDTKSDAGFAVNSGIQGMILETTDGGKYGMRHMNEMWVKVYKAAFAKDAGLEGKTVNRITYIMSDGAYVYEFADGIYIKPQATEEMDVSPEFTDSTHVKLANLDKYKNPKVSVFYTTGVGHDSQTTYLVQDGVAADGVVALDSTVARPENETYTVRVSSDDHADVSVQLVYGTIAFKENSGVLYVGSSRQLEATGENCKDVTYASDNETVASVDENGKVTAKAAGTAVITATSAAGKTAQYKLTVKTPSVKINVSSKTLYVKGSPATVTLKATTAGVTGKVTYTSSKPSVATVAANGKVTAKAAGTAVITAKCGNYKATCKITVKKPSVKASASAKTVFVGGTSQITVKKTGVSGKVTYTSSNKSVAVVSAGGKVTAKKAGTATITVKCGSYKATCKITVKKGSLKITSKTAVSVKAKKTTAIKAAATSKAKITYRSSNTKVATVSSKGVVKGVKKGKAVIYVSSNGITKKVTVTVK
ncbi:Ig-like domain-containing protein [Blautia massiliensis (ex Durand et al. 2017)]|uniref:Ig-like domain-containing protein n=1 Tax=Blautia massiliensis (ex Durand et al. 2017) TaxID=1737424 RepID=UPI0022E64053|nr:Ig-like domain-containing protein [Blautia massiliensis (ex Durand et al. 2017)]